MTYIYLQLYYNGDNDTPGEALQLFAYLPLHPGAIWAIQYLTDTLINNIHELAERRSQIPRTIGHMIYMT